MDDVFELGDPRYAAQVMPELYPKERQPVLANWSEEDREMYCGEYTPGRRLGLRGLPRQIVLWP